MPEKTPLGQTAGPESATTSIEAPVVDTIIGRIWSNKYAKEFILMLAATIGLQVAAALLSLSGQLESVNDIDGLYTTIDGWIGGAIAAVVLTTFKQSLAFVIAHLAGTKL